MTEQQEDTTGQKVLKGLGWGIAGGLVAGAIGYGGSIWMGKERGVVQMEHYDSLEPPSRHETKKKVKRYDTLEPPERIPTDGQQRKKKRRSLIKTRKRNPIPENVGLQRPINDIINKVPASTAKGSRNDRVTALRMKEQLLPETEKFKFKVFK